MNRTAALLAAGLLCALGACSSEQPRQISHDRAQAGMPPLTGQLPNGVIEDSKSK